MVDWTQRRKKVFLVAVDRRDADTLLPVLQEYIIPGSTVVSDLWRAYGTVNNIGYRHLTVNHRLNFVDLLHTQQQTMLSLCGAKPSREIKKNVAHTGLY